MAKDNSVNELAKGETASTTFSVYASDGDLDSDAGSLRFTIWGENDDPVFVTNPIEVERGANDVAILQLNKQHLNASDVENDFDPSDFVYRLTSEVSNGGLQKWDATRGWIDLNANDNNNNTFTQEDVDGDDDGRIQLVVYSSLNSGHDGNFNVEVSVNGEVINNGNHTVTFTVNAGTPDTNVARSVHVGQELRGTAAGLKIQGPKDELLTFVNTDMGETVNTGLGSYVIQGGEIVYTPSVGGSGTDIFTISAVDMNSAVYQVTFTMTVDLIMDITGVTTAWEDDVWNSSSGHLLHEDHRSDTALTVGGARIQGNGQVVNGDYGRFIIDGDGSWIYTLENNNGSVRNLSSGDQLTDSLDVTYTKGEGETSVTYTNTLSITINGRTDVPLTSDNTTPEDGYLVYSATSDEDFAIHGQNVRGTDYNLKVNAGNGSDVIYGGAGNDILNGDGGIDGIIGGAGNDIIYGGAEADRLIGGDGNDNLNGGAGADVLTGGANNDILNGGAGADTLTGEAGSDWFTVYQGARTEGVDYLDTVTDFVTYSTNNTVHDKIHIDGLDWTRTTVDDLLASASLRVEYQTVATGAFSDRAVIYAIVGENDVGSSETDDVALMALNGVTSLSLEDFVESTTYSPTATLNLSNLNGSNGFKLNGESTRYYSGTSVSSAGDVNKDGIDDLIIGAPGLYSTDSRSSASYVVFGKNYSDGGRFTSSINLSALNDDNDDSIDGFKINGESAGDRSGYSVSSAGDVNGDGIDDLIIGAPRANPNGEYSGSSYVVFGKDTTVEGVRFDTSINLSTLNDSSALYGINGFKINGERSRDWSGWSVSSAGDVNNDGFNDIIVGAYGAEPKGKTDNGISYVIFGKNYNDGDRFNKVINLSILNDTIGFKIIGENARDWSGRSVSSAGDVNGDGIDDLIIGADGANLNGEDSGSSYVVFGKNYRGGDSFGASIELSDLDGNNGFKINGERVRDFSGWSVSSAGDVNGDGIDDLIIGARGADSNGTNSGSSYVVFGKNYSDGDRFSASIELSDLDGNNGFKINGESALDHSGHSVSSAGDFNGDGYDDIIIGIRNTEPDSVNSGSNYVVFGKTSGFDATINLFALNGKNGFKLNGESANSISGRSASSAGDFNGDGYDDLIIGADPSASSYVVFGYATGATISGGLQVGKALEASTVVGTGIQHIWKRYDGDTVENVGTDRTYTLTDDDFSKVIKVEINYTNLNGDLITIQSDDTPTIGKRIESKSEGASRDSAGQIVTEEIMGTIGADLYRYDRGDGNDTITDAGGEDKLIFGIGITEAQVSFRSSGNDFVVGIDDDDDEATPPDNTITITDWRTNANNRIEKFVFDDGTVQTVHAEDFTGTDGADVYLYYRGDGNKTIIDTGGADQLIFANDITIDQVSISKTTNDLLVTISDGRISNTITITDGGSRWGNMIEKFIFNDGTVKAVNTGYFIFSSTAGDDVYLYGRDDGSRSITETGGEDQLIFVNGITVEQVSFRRINYDNLVVRIDHDNNATTTDETIWVIGWFTSADKKIEEFIFNDGTVITDEQISTLTTARPNVQATDLVTDLAADLATDLALI